MVRSVATWSVSGMLCATHRQVQLVCSDPQSSHSLCEKVLVVSSSYGQGRVERWLTVNALRQQQRQGR